MSTNFWELLQQHQSDLTKSGRTVAEYLQLGEMAQIMTDTVEYAWDTRPDEELEQVLAKKLKGMGLCVHSVLVYQEEHRRQEVYLTVSTRRRKCVATKDIAEVLSIIKIGCTLNFHVRMKAAPKIKKLL